MKILGIVIFLLFPILVVAQSKSDTSKTTFKSEIEFSIADGYFDIKQTKYYGLYKSSGQQYSYGLSYKHSLWKLFWVQLSMYYTEDEYDLDIYYPNAHYTEPPVMTKTVAILDCGAFMGLSIPVLNKFSPYIFAGFFISPLIKGGNYLDGIYAHVQSYQWHVPHQFNSTTSTMVGIGLKYYFVKHFGLDLQIDRRYFSDEFEFVPDNSIKNPASNYVVGITYRF